MPCSPPGSPQVSSDEGSEESEMIIYLPPGKGGDTNCDVADGTDAELSDVADVGDATATEASEVDARDLAEPQEVPVCASEVHMPAEREYVVDAWVEGNFMYLHQKLASAPDKGCCMVFGGGAAIGQRGLAYRKGFPHWSDRVAFKEILNKSSAGLQQKVVAADALRSLGATLTGERLQRVLRMKEVASNAIPKEFKALEPLTRLDLSDMSLVSDFGKCFLRKRTNLTSLRLAGFDDSVVTANDFLSNCTRLEQLDLSGLGSITRIAHNFAFKCKRLTTLDLSVFSNVTAIGDGFLSGCSKLTTLDLSGLSSVVRIGTHFLAHCISLRALDVSVLRSVRKIGPHLLDGCQDLKKTVNQTLVEMPGQCGQADNKKYPTCPVCSLNIKTKGKVVTHLMMEHKKSEHEATYLVYPHSKRPRKRGGRPATSSAQKQGRHDFPQEGGDRTYMENARLTADMLARHQFQGT